MPTLTVARWAMRAWLGPALLDRQPIAVTRTISATEGSASQRV